MNLNPFAAAEQFERTLAKLEELFAWIDENFARWTDPVTPETRALLEPRPVDPMHPPRYLFAPRESA